MNKAKKLLLNSASVVLAIMMLLSLLPMTAAQAYSAEQATLTFSDGAIAETVSGSGYSIKGTVLTISSPGTYRVAGSCSEGSVVVSKELSGVTLILDNLTLASSSTAPIVVKKSSSVLLKLAGTSTLTDNEDASTESTNEDFEGAAVKVKSGSSLTVFGDGSLNAVGNAKNGIKGAAETSLVIDGGTINATAENNGIAFDGSVVINAGTVKVTSGNDGIKAVPDEGDTASAGTVGINGGTITVDAQGDGIQAGTNLTITNGTFNIKTLSGYNSSSFNSSTMSCKGLKASGNDETTEDAANTITISGGTFNLNTADDAVHSDGYAVITGGTFYIYTGDDGVHADTLLTLGTENGYERDPEIYIYSSYEGLESGTINAYSGKYYVVASDDGINAAGGSSNGSDPGAGGGNHFNPGGGRGPGGNNRPGGNGGFGGNTSASGDYSLNIYGGSFYVDCKGDGLDSNGALNLYGGNITVFSQATGGDNSPLDSDGTLLIKGATVFGAGTNPMNETPSSSSQKYYTNTTSRSAGTVVNVQYNNNVVYSDKLLRNINYLIYSSPDMTSNSCTITTGGSVDSCKSNAWQHNWDSGVIETAATAETAGVIKYTCQDCGAVERKSIPKLTQAAEYVEDAAENNTTEAETTAYTATFATDSNASINVYYTQDYATPSETSVSTAIARNSATGEADSTGDGQINFAVVVADGYKVDSVTVDGSYKNLKNISLDEGIDNLYRVTKVAGDLKITVTTSKADGGEEEDKGCDVSFVTDGHATIDVYYTQDYSTPSETNVTSAVSRNGTSGVADSTGDGQVNFKVVTEDGYTVDSVTVDGSYKNLKTPDDLGIENVYRITKISGKLTVTVKTSAAATETTSPVSDSETTVNTDPTETTAPVSDSETTVSTDPTETNAPVSDSETTVSTDPTETTAPVSDSETTVSTDPTETTSPVTETTEPITTPTTKTTQATTAAPTQSTTSGVGAGADYTKVDELIKNSKTEEPAGAAFGKLLARATKVTKKSITLKWKKVSGVKKYIIYANACGTKNKFKKLTAVSSSKNTYKVTKAAGKKLKKGTYYKFLIVAVNSKNKVVSTACTLHIATKGGTKGNYKSVTTAAKKNRVSLTKKGKKFSLKAKAIPQSSKLNVKKHRAIKYESSNKKVATVTSKGVIVAKKKGTCYVYVYAQSGAYKKIKVTVKK